MTDVGQIRELISLGVHYAGMIFYDRSPRFVSNKIHLPELRALSQKIKLTGVFVNPDVDEVKKVVKEYYLSAIQLCGSESRGMCEELRSYCEVIKVIHVNEDTDLSAHISRYERYCDYFLFDTKSEKYGGSGKKFHWNQLSGYSFPKPFFLSGGISEMDVETLNNFQHPDRMGIDINSRFEISPGLKDSNKIKSFVKQLIL